MEGSCRCIAAIPQDCLALIAPSTILLFAGYVFCTSICCLDSFPEELALLKTPLIGLLLSLVLLLHAVSGFIGIKKRNRCLLNLYGAGYLPIIGYTVWRFVQEVRGDYFWDNAQRVNAVVAFFAFVWIVFGYILCGIFCRSKQILAESAAADKSE